LYAACDGRFDRMIELGALDEVRALTALDLPSDLPVMKALGVPELSSYLLGKSDLPAAAASARQSTRRYAKRQGTWFRHQLAPVHGCHVISTQYSESLKPVICNIIRKMG
jgi:tRNA dimethylallyltransferase